MGSGNKYGNSFMLTDDERESLIKLVYNYVRSNNLNSFKKDDALRAFASEIVSALYVKYTKTNDITKIEREYKAEINRISSLYGIKNQEEQIYNISCIGLCNIIVNSKEYDENGSTKVSKDNLSIYLKQK